MTNIIALDPGTFETGVASHWNGVWSFGVMTNDEVLEYISNYPGQTIAIEMIAKMGMPVGAEVFETCLWIGRFIERWASEVDRPKPIMVFRREVKMHLCGTAQGKDPHIRQALLDKFGPVGTKKAPGTLYGCKSHAWAALGVAVTALETRL